MLELHIVQVINGHSGKTCIGSTSFTSVKAGGSFSKLKGTAEQRKMIKIITDIYNFSSKRTFLCNFRFILVCNCVIFQEHLLERGWL